MIPTAYPEASRLAYRIRTALTGESVGLDTAKLAWQQAEAVSRANASLKRACDALNNGSLLDAVLIESAHPNLLETARSLDHSQTEEWQKRCETYGWRVSDAVDTERVSKIQDAIDAQGDLKDWLFKQYRSSVRSKDQLRAYQIIELIAKRFPDDENASQELASKRVLLVEQAASEVKDSLEQLIPAEPASEVARRYVALGLPLSNSSQPHLVDTLAEANDQRVTSISDRVSAVVEKAKDLKADENWREIENEYLACDYTLAVNEARGNLDPSLRAEFEKVTTRLARIRSQFESNISIRLAIDEVRNGRIHKGKPVPLGNRVAKLRSLEAQATKTGSQVPPELQAEIKAAYALARRKRFPLFAGTAVAALVLIFFASLLVQQKQRQEETAQLQADALAALQATERSGRVDTVRQTLETWEDAINRAEPGSDLASQAELLQDWLEVQSSLESQYTASVDDLAVIATSRDALDNEEAIKALAANIRRSRSDLAPDLGQEADSKFTSLLAQYNNVKAAAQEQDRQELERLEQELRVAAANAAQAKSRAEFERLYSAADARIASIATLLKNDSLSDNRNQLQPLIQSIQQQLSAIETKWAALDNAWLRLAQTKELEPYLSQLERIDSFDILPADQKSAMAQTLRLKQDFQQLGESRPVFSSQAAKDAFPPGQVYLSARIELSEEERAYLTRLQNDNVFSRVYQSTVQYFEGSAEPQSEYRIYLVQPISKSDTQEGESHVTFTFSIRGYDEFGNPENRAREIQFISRDDGSFWGFFYKPSELSPESEYYNTTISNTLTLLLSGADRLTAIKLIEDLDQRDELSPAFRVYWQQQLIGFTKLYPWKWGLALSPSLQKRSAQLNALPSGTLGETLWLSTIEQTVPSPEYATLAKRDFATSPSKEVQTLASLYQEAASGSYLFAGYVLADGTAHLLDDTPEEAPLWTVNTMTGSIDLLDSEDALTPYAPILRYSLTGGESPKAALRKASYASGLKLDEPPYQSLLPALFR